jgi:outer membrane lipoprotein-sorting protein
MLVCRASAQRIVSSSDATNIALVESYLNNLTTFEATFVQSGIVHKKFHAGHIWMEWNRNEGRIRMQYEVPNKDIFVGNILDVYFYDAETKETRHLPTKSTAFWYILKKTYYSDECGAKSHLQRECNAYMAHRRNGSNDP